MAEGTSISDKIANIVASRDLIVSSLPGANSGLSTSYKLSELPEVIRESLSNVSIALSSWQINRDTVESIDVSGCIPRVGVGAFYNCSSLKRITIREGVTEIGENAFYSSCNYLEELIIPSSIISIGSNAFYRCPSSCIVTFRKTVSDAKAIQNRPWGMAGSVVIQCTDGSFIAGST